MNTVAPMWRTEETGHPGPRHRTTREALGLTQRELGALAGCDRSQLSEVERGRRTPSPRWRTRITRALGEEMGRRWRAANS